MKDNRPPALRWKRLLPSGGKFEYVLRAYPAPGYPLVEIAYWSPEHGWCGDWTACAECGCVEEAGGHHRPGCPLEPTHRAECSSCRDHPPLVDAGPRMI